MCGRARCTLNASQVAMACGLQKNDADSIRTVEMDRFHPSYNVSPGTYLPVFMRSDAQGLEPYCAVHCMKWGLIPSFTKKTEKSDHYRMFNARSESIKEKASFRRLIPRNRCLVAVEGFYEWKKDGSKKQPYYIHYLDGRPLVFAALYDSWENCEGEMIYTFTILTTRSSPTLEWLHDRIPVIIENKDTINTWLSKSPANLEAVFAPADFDLAWYPVTSAMGKPSFDGPECIKETPLKPSVQNQISTLFSRKTNDSIDKCKQKSELNLFSDGFPKNENPNSLKEESAMEEDAKIFVHGSKHKVVESHSTKNAVPELHGLKRELEEMNPDHDTETNISNQFSSSVKKKAQSGDKQASLLSFFGKK